MDMAVSPALNALPRDVVDAGHTVHNRLGPGLFESVYEGCLAHKLSKRGVSIKRPVIAPVFYDDVRIDEGFRVGCPRHNSGYLDILQNQKFFYISAG